MLTQIFGHMDVLGTGLVEFENFKQVLEAKYPNQLPHKMPQAEDGFNWQQDVIKGIRGFVKKEKLSAHDAFRYFDQDFDGLVSKADMQLSL
jgi:hypothetical protein